MGAAVGDTETPCKFALKVIHAQEAGAQAVRQLKSFLLFASKQKCGAERRGHALCEGLKPGTCTAWAVIAIFARQTSHYVH